VLDAPEELAKVGARRLEGHVLDEELGRGLLGACTRLLERLLVGVSLGEPDVERVAVEDVSLTGIFGRGCCCDGAEADKAEAHAQRPTRLSRVRLGLDPGEDDIRERIERLLEARRRGDEVEVLDEEGGCCRLRNAVGGWADEA